MPDFNLDRDGRSDRERPLRPADDLGALGDREVPLASVATSDVINKWLDGEAPEPTGLRGDAARSVEFWRRLGEETDRRRHMVTPAHLPERIMASLPPVAPHGATTPWHRKEVKLSGMVLLGGAIGLLAIGAIVARLVA
ncbi:MAG: hypothetical protein IT361_02020 [Gemmatimonadaceae bacterium]|nr:hypothetical protein [Gemmatimonadaceae bacterium]